MATLIEKLGEPRLLGCEGYTFANSEGLKRLTLCQAAQAEGSETISKESRRLVKLQRRSAEDLYIKQYLWTKQIELAFGFRWKYID